jgi:hypothetical protein
MRLDLALVGVVLEGVENHSLGTLLAAARRSGASAQVVPFRGWAGMEGTLEALLRLGPRVCGVSLQTSEAALATMALIKLLRDRGFAGRIVCGGHFATLQAEEILQHNPAVDAVVRFAGEEALCGMLTGTLDDDALAELPGVVFRATNGALRVGAPARIRAPGPLDAVAIGEEPAPLHLGFGAADLIVSQGCESSCAYCCVAGATKLAGHEQRRGQLRAAPYARRPLEAIAEQIAALHRERGVEVFNFMDDNVLPLGPADVVEWATELRRALRARKVGPIALSMQVRADALTKQSAQALAELGLVRAYVGIDGYSAPQLRALGRRADADAGARALELLWEHGIFAVANSLLIGPTIGFESVVAEIEGLARIAHAPVHLLPIEARPGTRYFERAKQLGLLEGGFLLQHYRFVDRRTELLGRVVTSMPTRLAERSVPIALYDLGYNLGVARRLLPEAKLDRYAQEYARITAAWNRDQLRLLRQAADAARTLDSATVEALIERERGRVTEHDRALIEACDDALLQVEAVVSALRARTVRAHTRGKLLGTLALSMSLAGCSSHPASGHGGAGTGGGGGASVMDGSQPAAQRDAAASDSGSTSISTSMGSRSDASAHDAGQGAHDAGQAGRDAGPAPSGDAALAPDATATTCTAGDTSLTTRQGPCCDLPQSTPLRIRFGADGRPNGFSSTDGSPLSQAVHACLQAFVGDYCYPSLANTTQEFHSHCWIA